MQNLIQPTDDEASALPPTPATSHRSLGTRVAELFSLMPDSAAAGGSLRARFLLGLSVILVFVTVSFFTATWDEKIALAPLPLRLFNVAITLVAMAASLVVPFRRWQWWAMSFCLTLAASFTTDALMVDNDEPLFLALAVLVMVSAVFLP